MTIATCLCAHPLIEETAAGLRICRRCGYYIETAVIHNCEVSATDTMDAQREALYQEIKAYCAAVGRIDAQEIFHLYQGKIIKTMGGADIMAQRVRKEGTK
jgi:hypothetical protein